MSTEHYEMPHPLADQCEHAGVGKACKPCRTQFDATDDFTEAARAEAERAMPDRPGDPPGLTIALRAHRGTFTSAAEWARTHLAQEPTDAERAVRALHRQFDVYEHEDDCPDTSDEHRDAHHHEDSDGYWERYCDQRPLYTLCDHCRDEDGERADWPCPTIQALDAARAARRDEEKRDG